MQLLLSEVVLADMAEKCLETLTFAIGVKIGVNFGNSRDTIAES